jgi:acetoin utilization deacetylase AcuC-like enzyme
MGFFATRYAERTPITPGTWTAACRRRRYGTHRRARLIRHGEGGAFALRRPPGHHAAAAGYMGGYRHLEQRCNRRTLAA